MQVENNKTDVRIERKDVARPFEHTRIMVVQDEFIPLKSAEHMFALSKESIKSHLPSPKHYVRFKEYIYDDETKEVIALFVSRLGLLYLMSVYFKWHEATINMAMRQIFDSQVHDPSAFSLVRDSNAAQDAEEKEAELEHESSLSKGKRNRSEYLEEKMDRLLNDIHCALTDKYEREYKCSRRFQEDCARLVSERVEEMIPKIQEELKQQLTPIVRAELEKQLEPQVKAEAQKNFQTEGFGGFIDLV